MELRRTPLLILALLSTLGYESDVRAEPSLAPWSAERMAEATRLSLEAFELDYETTVTKRLLAYTFHRTRLGGVVSVYHGPAENPFVADYVCREIVHEGRLRMHCHEH